MIQALGTDVDDAKLKIAELEKALNFASLERGYWKARCLYVSEKSPCEKPVKK